MKTTESSDFAVKHMKESSTKSYIINKGFVVTAENIKSAIEYFQLKFYKAEIKTIELRSPSEVFRYLKLEDIKDEDKALIYDIKSGMTPPQASLHLINYWKYEDPIIEVPALGFLCY